VDLAATEVLGDGPVSAWWKTPAGLGLAAAALLTLGVVSALLSPASITAPSATAAPATPAPVSSAVAPVAGPPPSSAWPTAAGMPDLRTLPDEQKPLWQALGKAWGLELPERDFCAAALRQGVQCFRTTRLTATGLQQLDRPGLLLLRDQDASRWVLVRALREGQWQLRSGQQTWTVPLDDLPRWWTGEYASLWRLPPGQRTRVFTATPSDPAGRWLDQRLREMAEQGRLRVDGTDFAAHVRAFQSQHGLYGDGKALPSTFLLVNRLTGVDEPRLQDAPR
jgi:general secretion pathway protein A